MLDNLGIGGKLIFFGLCICLIFCVVIGLAFLFKGGIRKISNRFWALLLLTMGANLLHHLFILLGVYKQSPEFLFLPIYYTLWFGPLLFLTVKLRLYPTYKLRFTDLKHGILPFGQLLYFLILYASPVEYRLSYGQMGRQFWSPFYGAMEMLLYITTFYAYLYSAYRYIKHKKNTMRKSQNQAVKREVFFLKKMVKALVILFWINSGYILTDFFVYEIFGIDLHSGFGFTKFGDASFGIMTFWLSWCGLRMLQRDV